MTTGEYIRLKAQIAVLKELLTDYSHRTLDNIIQGLEARVREVEKNVKDINVPNIYNHEEDAMQVLRQLLL